MLLNICKNIKGTKKTILKKTINSKDEYCMIKYGLLSDADKAKASALTFLLL